MVSPYKLKPKLALNNAFMLIKSVLTEELILVIQEVTMHNVSPGTDKIRKRVVVNRSDKAMESNPQLAIERYLSRLNRKTKKAAG
jgi:hypothetical protein